MSIFDSLGSTNFLNSDLDKYIEEIWIICIDYLKLGELPKIIEESKCPQYALMISQSQ